MPAALMEVGGGAVLADVSGSLEYNSNTANRADGDSDTILTVSPSIRYESVGATVKTLFSIGVDYIQYFDESIEDFNINGDLSVSYPEGLGDVPYSVGLELGISQTTQGESDIGRIERTTTFSGALNGSYDISERLSVASGITYTVRDPESDDLSETRTYEVPVSVAVQHSEMLSISAGYRFRTTETPDDPEQADRTDHALYLSANGQVLPLVEGNITIGIQQRESDDDAISDQTAPYASVGLDWKISDLTNAFFTVSGDFDTTLDNRSKEVYQTSAGLNHQFNDFWSATFTASWSRTDISASEIMDPMASGERRDTEYTAGAALNYSINQRISVSLSAEYTENDSSSAENDFDRYVVALGANIPF